MSQGVQDGQDKAEILEPLFPLHAESWMMAPLIVALWTFQRIVGEKAKSVFSLKYAEREVWIEVMHH